jgi:hypothetical protein
VTFSFHPRLVVVTVKIVSVKYMPLRVGATFEARNISVEHFTILANEQFTIVASDTLGGCTAAVRASELSHFTLTIKANAQFTLPFR